MSDHFLGTQTESARTKKKKKSKEEDDNVNGGLLLLWCNKHIYKKLITGLLIMHYYFISENLQYNKNN